MALDATVGGASADSFASVADATTFLATTFAGTAWALGTDPTREVALQEATSVINSLRYDGEKVADTQALNIPRSDMPDPDAEEGTDFAEDEIPGRIFRATCRLAAIFREAGANTLAVESSDAGLIRKKVGPLEKEWASPAERTSGLQLYPSVWAELYPLLVSAGTHEVVRS